MPSTAHASGLDTDFCLNVLSPKPNLNPTSTLTPATIGHDTGRDGKYQSSCVRLIGPFWIYLQRDSLYAILTSPLYFFSNCSPLHLLTDIFATSNPHSISRTATPSIQSHIIITAHCFFEKHSHGIPSIFQIPSFRCRKPEACSSSIQPCARAYGKPPSHI